jgi:hypothetical protein
MRREMGKPTKKLTVNAISQISQKLGLNPAFISVRKKDITRDIARDTKVPNKRV